MEKKPISAAQKRAVQKYIKEKLDRVEVRFPKGYKEKIQAAAAVYGLSINKYIKMLIDKDIAESSGND